MQFRSSTVVYFYVLLGAILFANIDGVRADDNLRKQEVLADNRLTRETVLENHERRRDKLEELLQETREKVANHDAGRNLMEDEEYKTFAKRIGLYERKLEKMKSPLDDRDVERMLERERNRAERYNRFEL